MLFYFCRMWLSFLKVNVIVMNDIVPYIAMNILYTMKYYFFSFLYQLKNVDSLLQGYMNPNSIQGPVWGRINKYVH